MAKYLNSYRAYVICYWGEQSSQANSGIYRFSPKFLLLENDLGSLVQKNS
jgi:hypothetical protein